MLFAVVLFSCTTPALPDGQPAPVHSGAVGETSGPQDTDPSWGPLDTDPPAVTFDESTDVLVVGSGPAGMAAALAAREAGASVLVLERAETAATGVIYGSNLLAVGTEEQAAAGFLDSPAQAAQEWPQITGVAGDAPAVSRFLEASAESLVWLESLGAVVTALTQDHDSGSVSRLHVLQGAHTRAALLAAYDGELRTGAEVLAPVMAEGRVVGAIWRDNQTGALGTIRAGATVVATGGFLRDLAVVDAYRPELAGRSLLYETSPTSTGAGLPYLEAVGAGSQNSSSLGLYVHSLQDPDSTAGESVRLSGTPNFLLVGEDGRRFADETLIQTLDLFDALPDGEVYAVFPDVYADGFTAARPAYLWATLDVPEQWALPDLAVVSDEVTVATSEAELSAALGLDPDGLSASIDEANAAMALGLTDRFGRTFDTMEPLEDGIWWAVHLTPGLAKAFGGVATDEETHVLDAADAPISGLYAAGEVAGMIPEGGSGAGFSGSVNACYVFGRIAGANAAAEALAE